MHATADCESPRRLLKNSPRSSFRGAEGDEESRKSLKAKKQIPRYARNDGAQVVFQQSDSGDPRSSGLRLVRPESPSGGSELCTSGPLSSGSLFPISFFLLPIFLLFFTSALRAQTTYTVNVTTDAAPSPIAGGVGTGTSGDLRYAITQSNASRPPLGQHNTINITVPGTITLQGDLPAIQAPVAIGNTSGGTVTISGNSQFRCFFIGNFNDGSTLTATAVAIGNLTFSGCEAKGGAGGSVSGVNGGSGGGGGAGLGGAIFVGNLATVTLSNVSLAANDATGGAGGSLAGAIAGGAGGGGMGGNGGAVTTNGGAGGGGLGRGANGGTSSAGNGASGIATGAVSGGTEETGNGACAGGTGGSNGGGGGGVDVDNVNCNGATGGGGGRLWRRRWRSRWGQWRRGWIWRRRWRRLSWRLRGRHWRIWRGRWRRK
jgi:hypothetical protein